MSKQKRRGFTEEFKREAVRLVTDEGYSFAEAGRSLGVRGDMVARWKRRFEVTDEAKDQSRDVSDKRRIRELEAEDSIRLSDHRPLVVDYRWRSPAAVAELP